MDKQRHTYLILLAGMLWLSMSVLRAQAPFTGGSADGGAGLRRIMVSPCDPLAGNPYAGGPGSVAFFDSTINSVCNPGEITPFSGGGHDGFAAHAWLEESCAPVLVSIFSGGTHDGFAQHQAKPSECSSVIINPFSGGSQDGFAEHKYGDSECESVIINPFSGGDHDGFAEHAYVISDCESVIIDPFSGGNHDGFAADAWGTSPCTPILISIFSGGDHDGFAYDRLGDGNCVPELLSIFSGGGHDGHAAHALAASLGFSIPPPATTGVCVNNDVLISLPEAAPSLTYQWEVSTNGGVSFSSLSNTAPYSGVTTRELTISPAIVTYDGYMYRVFVNNPGCASGYSPLTTLDVGTQPVSATLVKSPNQDEVCPGVDVSASFTGASGGAGIIEDIHEYSTDAGSTWDTYVPSTSIPTGSLLGIGVVQLRTQRTTTGQGCIDGAINTAGWTVAGVGYWVGVTSSDWNTTSNWGCGTIPTITTDVTIPEVSLGNSQPNILITPNAFCRNLVIEPNASVTTYSGNYLEIHGNLTNNGIPQLGAGVVRFAGSNTQHIGGNSASYFSYIEVNNSTAGISLQLDQDITVAESLTLNDGIVDLNGHDIDLGNTGSLVGESETSRVTGYPGEIKSTVNMSSLSAAYNNIAGLGVSITTGPAVAPGQTVVNRGHYTYSLETDKHGIERYFRIEPTVNTDLDATLRIHYLDAELTSAAHTKDDLIPWRSEDDGVTWQGQFLPTAQLSNNTAANWVQQAGIPAFSIWTLSDWIQEPLPVEWLHFNAIPGDGIVNLDWATASEINSHYFTVERSPDAVHFTDILMQPAAGNSSTVRNYTDTDPQPLQGHSYYRLRQTDFDGSVKHSQIVPVYFDRDQPFMNAFVDGDKNFQIRFRALQREAVAVRLFDVAGRIIYSGQVNVSKGENAFEVYNPGLAKGIYVLELTGSESKISRSQKLLVK